MEIAELRSKIDLEKLYVDFGSLRNALTVVQVAEDLKVDLSEANKDGERRGTCPKCEKERSFSLNINTNRFNCFAKGCKLKGGGVIDFFAKLYEVSAKEASHLLAFIYGIQPYILEARENDNDGKLSVTNHVAKTEVAPENREVLESVFSSPEDIESDDTRQTAAYLIASIKHNLTQLEQLLTNR